MYSRVHLEMKRAPPFLHTEKKYVAKAVRVRRGRYLIVQGTEIFLGDGCVRKVKMRRNRMSKLFCSSPQLCVLERQMQQPPGYRPRGGGICIIMRQSGETAGTT